MDSNAFRWLGALLFFGAVVFKGSGGGGAKENGIGQIGGGAALQGAGCEFVTQGFGDSGAENVSAEVVVDGLEVPWGLVFLPNGELLVTERPGRVRRVVDGQLQPSSVAEIDVGEDGEGGLLGIAVHPDFASNRFFYLYYTLNKTGGTVNRIERFRLSEDGQTAASDRVILDDIPAGTFHNGGRLRFGPDGNLYVGTGDARDPSLSQDPGSEAGKILRVTPEGAVPDDNPTPGSRVFISGIRNTQGFDWLNSATLVVTDHGPTGELARRGGDEVSIANAGDNLGWPTIWQCGQGAGISPILAWQSAAPPGGAAIYRGNAIPAWQGDLFIGTLGSEHLHRVRFREQNDVIAVASHEVYFEGAHGRLRDIVNGPDGFLYVTTSNCDGRGQCPPGRDAILRILAGD